MTQYPKFSVNGIPLNSAQCSTLWCALQHFGMDMEDPNYLGDDDHGRTMTKLYLQRVNEINKIALDTTP